MGFTTLKSYGSQFSITNKITPVVKTIAATPAPTTHTAYQKLLVDKKPWERYGAESWDQNTNTLPELGGTSSRDATTSGISTCMTTGNGSTANIACIGGTATSTINFTPGSIPPTFTMCSITRYSGNTGSCILASSNGYNFLHGHWGVRRGICYYNNWMTQGNVSTGIFNNWLNCCGTNSVSNNMPGNILLDGIGSGITTGAPLTPANTSLGINLYGNEQTNFEFSQLLIFDQALTAAEMVIVSDAFQNYLRTGVLDTPPPPPGPQTPVFYYSFNTSLTYDEATNRDDGINHGAALDNTVFIRGMGSAKFTGSNSTSYVSTPSFPILANTGLTFSVWFKIPPGTLTGFTPIFSNNNRGSPTFIFGQDFGNKDCMFFYSTNAGNGGLINVFYTTPVFDNTWHHTVVSISSDDKTLRWFLDGVQITYSNRLPGTDPSVYPQNKDFEMGSAYTFTGSCNLDNFVFYDRELSASEAVQLYNS